jgi:hypothetical protein
LQAISGQLSGNFFYDEALDNPYPNPIVPKLQPGQVITIIDLDPLEVARQITLQVRQEQEQQSK